MEALRAILSLFRSVDNDVGIPTDGGTIIPMPTNPMSSGVLLAVLQSIGLVVLEAVLAFLANSTNLQGLVNPQMAMLVAAIALAVENTLYNKTGKSLLGTTNL